jgi:hypothetical protein
MRHVHIFESLSWRHFRAGANCRSLTISANARRRQQGERHAHLPVRVLADGSDVDRKLLMETLTA